MAAGSSSVRILCQALLFDMDGLLISSLGSVERSWTRWARMRGVDPAEVLRIAHGCRAIETVRALRPDLDSESELKVIEGFEMADGDGIAALPGVLELLAALPPNRWTVVTSATERLARARLAAGGVPPPEKLISAELVTQGKPHPQPFLAGAAALGFPPPQCVVFEDAPSGVKSGRAAGCTVVATPYSHPLNSLADAHYVVEDLRQVTAVPLPDGRGLQLEITPLAR